MIEIRDKGVILSVKHFQEKFLIVKCFSENNGIISGLIRVSKKKNENIPGSIIFFYWKARLNDQLGYLKIEILDCVFSDIIFDKNKISILNSTISMIKVMLKDREVNKLAFRELHLLLKIICTNDILNEVYKAYINFEKKLLNYCGYGLDWSRCAITNSSSNLKYVSPRTGNAVTAEVGAKYQDQLFKLPKFLINNNIEACKQDIMTALNLVGYFFEKFIFTPNYIRFPEARINLIKYIEAQ
jgi:DNA repair protein RecO (recombination protein O)